MVERPAPETGGYGSRFKVGLETPLSGRFQREGTRLLFAPPDWYTRLVTACVVGGAILAVSRLVPLESPFDPGWRLWVGLAVSLAGVWAMLSNERLLADLKTRAYTRWEGQGPARRTVRGTLAELEALTLLTEVRLGSGVVYRLVLTWKGARHPLLVVEQESAPLPPGRPLNAEAGRMFALGSSYAAALGVPFFDRSMVSSPEPLRPV